MRKLVHNHFYALVCTLSLTLGVAACSSSPGEEEMRQLNDLKAEVESLQREISAKEKEKSGLEQQVAEKNKRLEMCKTDQEAVKKGAVK